MSLYDSVRGSISRSKNRNNDRDRSKTRDLLSRHKRSRDLTIEDLQQELDELNDSINYNEDLVYKHTKMFREVLKLLLEGTSDPIVDTEALEALKRFLADVIRY